jgi:hypothetical protein
MYTEDLSVCISFPSDASIPEVVEAIGAFRSGNEPYEEVPHDKYPRQKPWHGRAVILKRPDITDLAPVLNEIQRIINVPLECWPGQNIKPH